MLKIKLQTAKNLNQHYNKDVTISFNEENATLNAVTSVPANILSGNVVTKAAKAIKLPVNNYDVYEQKTRKIQAVLKTGILAALKIAPGDFLITLPIINEMRRGGNPVDTEILDNINKLWDKFNNFVKKCEHRVDSKSITAQERSDELKHLDTNLRALAKKMDNLATKYNIKAVQKIAKSDTNGSSNKIDAKNRKISTYNKKVATESSDFNLSYSDIRSIITENGEITDNTYNIINAIIDTDNCNNTFYEYFTDTAIDIINSSYTYDEVFESLEEQLEDGLITMEYANELNDLAYDKYILKNK